MAPLPPLDACHKGDSFRLQVVPWKRRASKTPCQNASFGSQLHRAARQTIRSPTLVSLLVNSHDVTDVREWAQQSIHLSTSLGALIEQFLCAFRRVGPLKLSETFRKRLFKLEVGFWFNMDCLWSKHPWRCHAIFPWNGPEAEAPRVQALKGSDNSKTFHVWFRLDRIHVHATKHQGHHKRRATVLQCTSLETARHPAYIMSWLFFARSTNTNDYAKHLQTIKTWPSVMELHAEAASQGQRFSHLKACTGDHTDPMPFWHWWSMMYTMHIICVYTISYIHICVHLS